MNNLIFLYILIQWQFLARDEGETELETTAEGWVEDEGKHCK